MPVPYVANLTKSWYAISSHPPPTALLFLFNLLLLPPFQFQMYDISNMVDELLSQNSAALTEDGIKLVKVRVLHTVQGLLDTALTFDRYACLTAFPSNTSHIF
jgi:hypothetical protein